MATEGQYQLNQVLHLKPLSAEMQETCQEHPDNVIAHVQDSPVTDERIIQNDPMCNLF